MTDAAKQSRSVQVRISGRAQRVGFRYWTKRQATELGLSGWVRNLQGGDVEALFSGPTDAIEAMLTRMPERAAAGTGG